ncbi:MAG TPA: DUF1501 domain-containing protein [Pirellulales bacterium]|nr:DUF1501 domain-containing protein [Pirellulales bacterium]
MLTFFDGRRTRREFLRVGGLTLGGLTLPRLWELQAQAASGGRPVTDKSVVFLFLQGGPSQFETFDPKMSAPSNIRSATGEIATSLSGVTYGGTFERLAKLAHKTTIVRSFRTGDAIHNIKPVVCKDTLDANLGSLYARIAGTNDPISGMPLNVALFPRAVDPKAQAGTMNFGRFDAVGSLGSAYAPFIPGGDGTFQQDLQLKMPRNRLDDRRHLLRQLDGLKRGVDSQADWQGFDRLQQQAFDAILGGVGSAFDWSKEDPRTIKRYDTSSLVRPESISKRWNNHEKYADHVASLGKLMLLARRLCEAGCGFVTVTTNFVWDMHADQNNAPVEEGMGYCGRPLDHAVSAFIEDVEARGLSKRILLVICGEMGRTPRLNPRGGRDHWGNLAPLMLYGGGLNMGRVVGQSTRDGGEANSDPVAIPNLVATVLQALLDVGKLRTMPGVPSDLARVVAAEPIPGLIG